MAFPTPRETAGQPAPPALAQSDPQRPGPAANPGNGAAPLAAQYGGLAGGRGTKDGLVPGSPEYVAARKEADKLRKRTERAEKKPDPAPLPSAIRADSSSALAQSENGVLGDPVAPVVPWTPEMVRPCCNQTLKLLEEADLAGYRSKCAQANLPGALTDDVLRDARWPEAAKKSLESSGADVAAEALNAIGVDSKWRHALTVAPALILILQARAATNARLDKLIELANQPASKPKP